ncbi:MAG TPA: hypothetical protein VFS76_09005 [Pyrinomonadaceae bacterium]|nr:hypothetical protein [Pyrinomonadaceae bacterium]
MRDVLAGKEPENFNWNDTWLASMFRSGEIAEQRKLEMERRLGITPEVKRYNEIKAGVITSSVGIAVAIFLFIFMQGIAGKVDPDTVPILTRLWVAGAIPFFVGMALILNGLVVSKKQAEIMERELNRSKNLEDPNPSPRSLRPADTNEFIPTHFSVTDSTTRHLVNTEKEQKH